MGKKGNWFSAIKRAFVPSSKDKVVNGSEKTSSKEKKKKGLGKLKHGDSFIPLFREPSSIEKILGEAEREQHQLIDFRPLSTSEQPRTPSFVSPRAASPLQDATSQLAPSPPRAASPPRVSSSCRVDSPPRSATLQRATTPPKSATPQRATTPPTSATPQRATTPPMSATPQRATTPPTRATPQRATTPPTRATPQRATTPPKSSTPPRATTPPTSAASQRATTPPTSAAPQRATTPPTSSIPQRATTLPKSSTPQRATTPPKSATAQRAATPPKPATPQRATTPPKSATPQRATTPPKGTTSQRVVSPPSSTNAPQSATPQRASSPTTSADMASSPHAASSSSNAATPQKSTSSRFVHLLRPEPTLKNHHICATRIQAVYRGYMARRRYRSLRGLVRLQGVVKGQSVKRQTASAMKSMQFLVRVQTQIQSRRIQMLENQAIQRQALYKNEKDLENGFGKWNSSQVSENGDLDEWDDSMLTKEEIETRRQRKFEAITKRERAMAYAYSHQSSKTTPKTAQTALMDIRASGGFPWWWNWLDRQMNPYTTPTKPSESETIKKLHSMSPRPAMASPLIPHSSNHSQQNLRFDNSEAATPRSTRSAAVPSRMKLSPTPPINLPRNKFTRSRATAANNSPFGSHFKDDDSLTSCPPFSMPRYMEPTLSAKAKVRGGFGISPDDKSKRRVSFPLAQGVGSFKWNKRGSLFSASTTPNRETGSGSQSVLEKKQSLQSIGNLSVDSTVSMPAAVGRKPFNRFV